MVREEWVETAVFALLAALAGGFVLFCFRADPVLYSALVAEDSWSEYGTAMGFAIAGVLSIRLALAPGPRLRRIVLAVIGTASLFVAGEEVSWGQRIFHVATPAALAEMNTQAEINLHNLEPFEFILARLHRAVGWATLLWLALSAGLWFRSRARFDQFRSHGLPLIPIRLAPLFLLVPYVFLLDPVAKPDEIGEFFVAAALAVWATDFFVEYGRPLPWTMRRAVSAKLASLALIAILAAGATWLHAPSLTWRLNVMAKRDYPGRGLPDQALELYAYIYAHPEHLMDDTQIEHGKLLLRLGRRAEAEAIAMAGVRALEARGPEPGRSAAHFRHLAAGYELLGATARGESQLADRAAQPALPPVGASPPRERRED